MVGNHDLTNGQESVGSMKSNNDYNTKG